MGPELNVSGGDLGQLVQQLDEPFPVMTQAEAAKARVTLRVLTRRRGLEPAVAAELIDMCGTTAAQMTESRWAESP